MALSLGLLMSGTGDLATFRLLRRLRAHPSLRPDSTSTAGTGPSNAFGANCALHSAIGFLFLGGGRLAFGRTDEAVAALLLATLPRY